MQFCWKPSSLIADIPWMQQSAYTVENCTELMIQVPVNLNNIFLLISQILDVLFGLDLKQRPICFVMSTLVDGDKNVMSTASNTRSGMLSHPLSFVCRGSFWIYL